MSSSWAALPSVHGVSRHPRISIAVQRVSQSLGHSSANKNEPDGSFPERTKCTKPRRPRPSAAGKRVSPRPAWLTERPAVRVRKDLADFFEFFTPLHFCVARPRQDAQTLKAVSSKENAHYAHQIPKRRLCRLWRKTGGHHDRSEEHTSELQSLRHLVCRLLLEKKEL